MDSKLKEQLNYGGLLLEMWFKDGPDGWDFSGNNPSGTGININGRIYNSVEIDTRALQCKREGKYAEAVGLYLRSLEASKKKGGKLPISTMKGYWKVLVSSNAFYQAFCVASTVAADMQNAKNVNQKEYELFMGYFFNLVELSKMIIDRNDFSAVKPFAANYSGSSSYQLQRSSQEIRDDFKKIRDEVRQVYGR